MSFFPFLTNYDPLGTSEGTLDPLGFYQIADRLAMELVPSVRERMQRIRFLTAMAVGALVTEGMADDRRHRDASPYLVWEWLVVEALVRERSDDPANWGIPGILVTQRAINQHEYLDARSYLKTPRVFGFHGVYKRLADHLGLIDVNLQPGRNMKGLVDAWAQGLNLSGMKKVGSMIEGWSTAVRRSLTETTPRSKTGWGKKEWAELAEAFAPSTCSPHEKIYLYDLLHTGNGRPLGALPEIWKLQSEFKNDDFGEELLHELLEEQAPHFAPLLRAIKSYESFARSLQDGFDILRAEAGSGNTPGFVVTDIAKDHEFKESISGLHKRYQDAYLALGKVPVANASLHGLFAERFEAFAEPMDANKYALALCDHHEKIQRAKSADGKRSWFDRIGPDRIHIRLAYRKARPKIQPGRYVHGYRGWPIRRFYQDLA